MTIDIEALKSQGETQKIKIASGEANSDAQIVVQTLTTGQRTLKGIGIGLLCLVVTAFSALIPGFHFISVPVLLVVTVLVVMKTVKAKTMILGGQGTCPMCSKPFYIHKRPYRFPFADVCESCSRSVDISLAA